MSPHHIFSDALSHLISPLRALKLKKVTSNYLNFTAKKRKIKWICLLAGVCPQMMAEESFFYQDESEQFGHYGDIQGLTDEDEAMFEHFNKIMMTY